MQPFKGMVFLLYVSVQVVLSFSQMGVMHGQGIGIHMKQGL
jgi:hypothetical protein